MKPGEIIYTTNLEVMPPGTRSAFYFNANKEDTFVLIFLGIEPRNGSTPLDVVHALNDNIHIYLLHIGDKRQDISKRGRRAWLL